MKWITRESMAVEFRKKFTDIYGSHRDSFACPDGQTLGEVRRRISEMPATPTPEEVDAIWPYGWTDTPKCDECRVRNVPVVQVGEEPDYESATAHLCADCIRKAFAMVMP